jgi:HAD superfamily hydrolase (TIGR01509 family)
MISNVSNGQWVVIFDMDGVLLDSEPVQMQAFNLTMKPYGIVFNEAEFKEFIGIRSIDNFRAIKNQYKLDTAATELNRKKEEHYHALISKQAKPRSGIINLLHDLEAHNVYRAVASSSPRHDVTLCLEKLVISNRFHVITTGDDVKLGKPDPEIFELTQKRISKKAGRDIPTQHCIVIEDNAFGVKAAVSAGMRCIAAPTSLTADQDFSQAVRVVDDIDELDIELLFSLIG